jgi:hypothetical protein
MAPKATTPPRLETPTVRADPAEASARTVPQDAAEPDQQLYTHLLTVLSVSSGMVGVCLTAIGLIGIMKALNRLETVVDDLLAVTSLLFMFAAVQSFLGMRTRLARTWRSFARTLDVIFCLGLVLMVVASILLTWVVL